MGDCGPDTSPRKRGRLQPARGLPSLSWPSPALQIRIGKCDLSLASPSAQDAVSRGKSGEGRGDGEKSKEIGQGKKLSPTCRGAGVAGLWSCVSQGRESGSQK